MISSRRPARQQIPTPAAASRRISRACRANGNHRSSARPASPRPPGRRHVRAYPPYFHAATALVSLHEATRKRADDGDAEMATALDQLGLGTVSI